MGAFEEEVLMLPATEWCPLKKSQMIRFNFMHYDFDEDWDICTALDVYGYGYIPLSHSEARRFENWINNNNINRVDRPLGKLSI